MWWVGRYDSMLGEMLSGVSSVFTSRVQILPSSNTYFIPSGSMNQVPSVYCRRARRLPVTPKILGPVSSVENSFYKYNSSYF